MTIIEISKRFNLRPRKTKELLGIPKSQNPLVDFPISPDDLQVLANFKARLKAARKRRGPKKARKKRKSHPYQTHGILMITSIRKFK